MHLHCLGPLKYELWISLCQITFISLNDLSFPQDSDYPPSFDFMKSEEDQPLNFNFLGQRHGQPFYGKQNKLSEVRSEKKKLRT